MTGDRRARGITMIRQLQLHKEFDALDREMRDIRACWEPATDANRKRYQQALSRSRDILTEMNQLQRNRFGPVWDDPVAFAKLYGPRPYSGFAPLRALQVIADWYLAPAVLFAALLVAWAVAVWLTVQVT